MRCRNSISRSGRRGTLASSARICSRALGSTPRPLSPNLRFFFTLRLWAGGGAKILDCGQAWLGHSPTRAFADDAAGARERLEMLLDGAAFGILVVEIIDVLWIDETVRDQLGEGRRTLPQMLLDRRFARVEPRRESVQQAEKGLAVGDYPFVVPGDPDFRGDVRHCGERAAERGEARGRSAGAGPEAGQAG